MNYKNENYSWFENPEFVSNQDELLKRNGLFTKVINQNKAFDIDQVFNSDDHLKDANLKVPNLTGNDQFSSFAANNPIPKDLFGTEKAKDPSAPASNFLGTRGEGEAAAIASMGMKGIQMAKSTSSTDGEAISNGLDITMKGAQAGMAVAGPYGAAVGAAAGLVYGIYDGFADAGARGREERKKNKEIAEKEHTELEQQQRQKDGLDSLSNLTALRKQQEKFII